MLRCYNCCHCWKVLDAINTCAQSSQRHLVKHVYHNHLVLELKACRMYLSQLPQPGPCPLQDAAAVRASAAAANVISNEQPCRVKLRIWRYSPSEDVPGTSGALKGKGKEKASSSKHHQSGAPLTNLAMSCVKMKRRRNTSWKDGVL